MVGVFIIALALWVLGSFINVDATLTAFIALALLLLTGVLAWSDILNETGAWNTLVWFSVLVLMAEQLNKLGFIPWLSKLIAQGLNGFSWPIVLVLLILFYFYSHYLFASATAHVSAMYAALLVLQSLRAPPLFSALMLGSLVTYWHQQHTIVVDQRLYYTQLAMLQKALVDYEYCTWYSLFYYLIGVGSLWMKLIGMM